MTLYPLGVYLTVDENFTRVEATQGATAVSVSTKECSQDGEKRVEQPHKDALRRRMNRLLGQAQGVARMIEEDRYCVDILVQISAVRSALDQVAMQLVEDHTKGCVRRAIQAGEGDETIAELMEVLRRFAK